MYSTLSRTDTGVAGYDPPEVDIVTPHELDLIRSYLAAHLVTWYMSALRCGLIDPAPARDRAPEDSRSPVSFSVPLPVLTAGHPDLDSPDRTPGQEPRFGWCDNCGAPMEHWGCSAECFDYEPIE